MKRFVTALSLPLWLGAASPGAGLPDTVEVGRVAATLSDWQTICYFLIFLLVVSTIERIVSGVQQRSTARLLADAIDRLGDVSGRNASDIKVQLALVQQALTRIQP